jgi:hypothetical protein
MKIVTTGAKLGYFDTFLSGIGHGRGPVYDADVVPISGIM